MTYTRTHASLFFLCPLFICTYVSTCINAVSVQWILETVAHGYRRWMNGTFTETFNLNDRQQCCKKAITNLKGQVFFCRQVKLTETTKSAQWHLNTVFCQSAVCLTVAWCPFSPITEGGPWLQSLHQGIHHTGFVSLWEKAHKKSTNVMLQLVHYHSKVHNNYRHTCMTHYMALILGIVLWVLSDYRSPYITIKECFIPE